MNHYYNVFFVFIILLVGSVHNTFAQTIPVTEQQVKKELEDRGIEESVLLQALSEKGINVTDLSELSPSELIELEKIVSELERKKPDVGTPDTSLDKEQFLDDHSAVELVELQEKIEETFDDPVPDVRVKAIYGHDFFINKDLSLFEKSTEVKAPATYQLGSGDKLVISIWGISQTELDFEIDAEGYIEVRNRRVFLKGQKLGDAKKKLERIFSNLYRFNSGEFDVAISYSRTVNVNVQGEVMNPGGYTISAVNNVFNLLIAAGGPSMIGSLRDILLIKKNGEVVNLDFYAFLSNPTEAINTSLEEGDVIVIPVARKLVSIAGGVKRPMIYELKNNEKLSDLVALAGGFSRDAKRAVVQTERFVGDTKNIIDVESKDLKSFQLKDGDIVRVSVVTGQPENIVEVSGAVLNVGKMQRTENMKLSDVVKRAVLKRDARMDLLFVRRKSADGNIIYHKKDISEGSADLEFIMEDQDGVRIFSLTNFEDAQHFSVSGAVRNPGRFIFGSNDSLAIKDAIELAGGLRRDASGYAIIHKIDPLNPKVKIYRRVNLVDAFDDFGAFSISSLDSLEIFSKGLFNERSSVFISGAVNKPGQFQYGAGMTLGDLLTMTGGFQLGAATNRIEVSRLEIKENLPTKTIVANLEVDREITDNGKNMDFILSPYDEIMVRYVSEFEFQKVVTLSGEVKYPGEYSLISDNETVKEVIDRAGGLTNEAFPAASKLYRSEDDLGFVILKLDQVLEKNSSRYNFIMKDGDRITIPKSKDFVSIKGGTNAKDLYDDDIVGTQNQLNVPYHSGKDARFYIDKYAGGIAPEGDANDVFVEYANGEIVKTQNYFVYRNYPEVQKGSKIIVGYKPIKSKEEKEREDVDWTQVLNDSVAQAMSVLTLLLLIERL